MNAVQSVGIIGQGNFGRFVATLPPDTVQVIACDETTSDKLAQVAQQDVVVLAVPLAAYPVLLPQLALLLAPQTLVVDVCSVKMKPHALLAQHLVPGQPLLLTHPLFGPQSARDGTAGHELIVTAASDDSRTQQVLDYCQQTLGLTVHHMTDEAHDQAMAHTHALTFFVARALANAGVADNVPFAVPSFKMLRDLAAFDRSQSEELFATIQDNPFAAAARHDLLTHFQQLTKALDT